MEEQARHAGLRAWLRREGASVDHCQVGTTLSAGYAVCTTRTLRCGDEIFCCPLYTTMRAADALADVTIGGALQEIGTENDEPPLDDRALLMMLLIHSRSQGDRSFWSHYIGVLPGQELVATLPMHWDSERLDLLAGTPLRRQAQQQHTELARLFDCT